MTSRVVQRAYVWAWSYVLGYYWILSLTITPVVHGVFPSEEQKDLYEKVWQPSSILERGGVGV
jgi:hypothetical protein